MFRTKDFILMDVVDIKGKKVGFVNDIIIDFHKGEVKGFVVSSYRILQKTIILSKEDIISFNKTMVIANWRKGCLLKFSDIKNMDIVNRYGDIIGMVEDILFHEFTFKIYGLVVSTGFIKNIVKGKRILLMNSVILGNESILVYSLDNRISFSSVPHKIFTEEECHEESI
jgi:uncharacterized protein YrrD